MSTAQETGGGGEKCRHQLVVCSRYLGSKNQESNMALIEIGFVSGYEVDKVSLNVRDIKTQIRVYLSGDEGADRQNCDTLSNAPVFEMIFFLFAYPLCNRKTHCLE